MAWRRLPLTMRLGGHRPHQWLLGWVRWNGWVVVHLGWWSFERGVAPSLDDYRDLEAR